MAQRFNTDHVEIDLSTWPRRPLFELFNSFSDPYHGVCLRLDCTETFRFAKAHKLSVFLSLLHRALYAAHQVENFRLRAVGDSVLRFDTIHGGSAIGRENGTIGFGHYTYHPRIEPFVREAALEVTRIKATTDIERFPTQNVIRFSVLPWFDFTSISHATDAARRDSAPKITFGKITEANGKHTMPVSIHAHHALVDGSHVADFVDRFQHALDCPDAC